MRSLVLALAAMALATGAAAGPKPAEGPYTVDSHGKCRAANGASVLPRLCHVPADLCKDPRTQKIVKCNTRGAVPA